uniref:Uncharacterized protein n=1 Tax=Rhizophora mucronata TaxID=61149 RepID=A0A2P2P5B7_RHIMU
MRSLVILYPRCNFKFSYIISNSGKKY